MGGLRDKLSERVALEQVVFHMVEVPSDNEARLGVFLGIVVHAIGGCG